MKEDTTATISVYLFDGTVFEYETDCPHKAREHTQAIVLKGYRSVDANGLMTHWPPHKIDKVTATGQNTKYPDRIRGT